MAGVETPEIGSPKAGPAGGCARVCGACPMAGSCGRLTVRGESGSGEVLVFEGSFKKLLSLPKLPSVIDLKHIYFDSARSENICDKCNKPASACSCSEPSKN